MNLARILLTHQQRRLRRLRDNQKSAQDRCARVLARRLGSSSAGAELDLAGIRTSGEFCARVPLFSYEELRASFERPLYWGLTSGSTSGCSKEIPVTRELLKNHSSGMTLLLAAHMYEQGSLSAFRGSIFFMSSMEPILEGEDGVPRGWSSSIGVKERPRILRKKIYPANELDQVEEWDAKLDGLIRMGRTRDTRVAVGLPPWLLALAEHAKSNFGIENMKELWPNLELIVTSGVAFAPYRERIERAYGRVCFRDVYSATEATMAIEDHPGALLPLADAVLLEFIAQSDVDQDKPPRVPLAEVESGQCYEVVCSTFGGLYGYRMGDLVKIIETDPVRFVVVGRSVVRLDVAGERLPEAVLERVVQRLDASMQLQIREYCVVPMAADMVTSGPPHHHWYLETEKRDHSEDEVATRLDEILRDDDKEYDLTRQGSAPTVGPPLVSYLSRGTFERWLRRLGRVGGALKVPRVVETAPVEFEP